MRKKSQRRGQKEKVVGNFLMKYSEKIKRLFEHIRNVQDNCLVLAEKFYENGNEELAAYLVANGMKHDNSKFFGLEWKYLNQESIETDIENFKKAATKHINSNLHHPEAWGTGVKAMPDIYLAEMVCDWCARSKEFGNNIYDWVDSVAYQRFNLGDDKEKYVQIMEYIDIITKIPF